MLGWSKMALTWKAQAAFFLFTSSTEGLDTLSRNNLIGMTLRVTPIWGLSLLPFMLSCLNPGSMLLMNVCYNNSYCNKKKPLQIIYWGQSVFAWIITIKSNHLLVESCITWNGVKHEQTIKGHKPLPRILKSPKKIKISDHEEAYCGTLTRLESP